MELERISSVRISPDVKTVSDQLGLLQNLAGNWRGEGLNLIARPNFEGNADLYLQVNQTQETFNVDPIGSPIPNRGFGQNDIELFGLTYLQKISDAPTGGAMHIEPGIWVRIPDTTYPPDTAPGKSQLVARMGTIPHGNSLLAQGTAEPFTGTPLIRTPGAEYAFSQFPSFNSTPFPTLPTAPPVLNAAGSSEKLTVPAPFTLKEYDLTVPAGATNPRTPFGTTGPPLPPSINGIGMQDLVNDPIRLLQKTIQDQVREGCTFEGVVLNIATQANVTFFQNPNSTQPTDPTVTVSPFNAAGGTENILFLEGGEPQGAKGPNAQTALVYATFWLEKVSRPGHPSFMQLQYAQMVILNFPLLLAPTPVNLGWPHVSVATLRKTFS